MGAPVSVETAGEWITWPEVTAQRDAARRGREEALSLRRQREPRSAVVVQAGLVNSDQAAELLERDQHHLAYLARTGRVHAQRHGGLWWFDPADLTARREEQAAWISWAAAADLVGCPSSAIVAAAGEGAIEAREAWGCGAPPPSARQVKISGASAWAIAESPART